MRATCYLFVLIVITVLNLTQILASKALSPIQPRLLSVNLPRATTPPTCLNKFGPLCGDCNTLWSCVGREEPVLQQNCGAIYPGQPYCVENTCTNESDPNDVTCSTGIQCTDEGYFPNPLNCSQFYLCGGPLGQSQLYECLPGFVYNPVTKDCKRRLAAADCNTINCAGNVNRYVVYPGDAAYYALCLQVNGVIDPIIFRCEDPDNFKYNPSTRRCTFQCRAEGRVADKTNCQRYYECFRIGVNFVSRLQTCLAGYIYNETTRLCVKGSCEIATTPPPTTTPTPAPATTPTPAPATTPTPAPATVPGNGGAGNGAGNGGAGSGVGPGDI